MNISKTDSVFQPLVYAYIIDICPRVDPCMAKPSIIFHIYMIAI